MGAIRTISAELLSALHYLFTTRQRPFSALHYLVSVFHPALVKAVIFISILDFAYSDLLPFCPSVVSPTGDIVCPSEFPHILSLYCFFIHAASFLFFHVTLSIFFSIPLWALGFLSILFRYQVTEYNIRRERLAEYLRGVRLLYTISMFTKGSPSHTYYLHDSLAWDDFTSSQMFSATRLTIPQSLVVAADY